MFETYSARKEKENNGNNESGFYAKMPPFKKNGQAIKKACKLRTGNLRAVMLIYCYSQTL